VEGLYRFSCSDYGGIGCGDFSCSGMDGVYQNPRVLAKSGWGELVAFFPDGHNFKPEVNYYYLGNGVKSAIIPITPTRAYWFVC
jgi:hypothetical protein